MQLFPSTKVKIVHVVNNYTQLGFVMDFYNVLVDVVLFLLKVWFNIQGLKNTVYQKMAKKSYNYPLKLFTCLGFQGFQPRGLVLMGNETTPKHVSMPTMISHLRWYDMFFLPYYLNMFGVLQDVLYTICNNCGPVQRIVIFRKNGVQAMVEYPLQTSTFFYLATFFYKLSTAG